MSENSFMQPKPKRLQLLVSLAVSSMILSLLAACTSSSSDCDYQTANGQTPQNCRSGGSYSGGSSYYGSGGSRSSGSSDGTSVRSGGRSGFGSFGGGRAGG